MRPGSLSVKASALFCLCGTWGWAAGEEPLNVPNVVYLQGVPGHSEKIRGSLRLDAAEISFSVNGKPLFAIRGKAVDHVAAQAKATIRARTADVGAGIMSAVGVVLPVYPLVFAFHRAEQHLLSIEYLEGEKQIRRLALFNVRDHSARAVKKIIDTKLGLTPDYYRDKEREEEQRRRAMEAERDPAGYWEAAKNTMVGDSQYERVLFEKGKYAVLIFDRYVGFRPEGQAWAKYRIPIREVKPSEPESTAVNPVFKKSRLVGIEVSGKRHLFY